MKKTVTLLVLLCFSVSVVAQFAYPVPTLVERSVPGFTYEKKVQDRLTPDVTYPLAYVPMVDKQSCFRNCLDVYNQCTRYGGDFVWCRYEYYFPCVEACPLGSYPGPAISYPSGSSSCLAQCDDAYQRCLNAGGSVTVCSNSVLNPCRQSCDVDFPELKPERQMPAGLSCVQQCKFKFDPCFQSGSSGCSVAMDACVSACPVLQLPVVVAEPAPMPVRPVPMPVVFAEPTFWEKVRRFFFG